MSKNSPKQKYIQLREWLATRKPADNSATKRKASFSKADHYKRQNRR